MFSFSIAMVVWGRNGDGTSTSEVLTRYQPPARPRSTAAAYRWFVSGAVIYLSTIEWRDRRRRKGSGKS